MCPPYTSHQPPAIFHTAPTPVHPLRARLHCHIGTCLSIHVSHCLEEFSPQTSPSGIIYPMVGVPSMCPPVKTHIKFQRSPVKSGSVSNVECSTKSGGVRRELNLCVGSPVTEAYG